MWTEVACKMFSRSSARNIQCTTYRVEMKMWTKVNSIVVAHPRTIHGEALT
jgi:hypothetical protein